MFIHRRHGWQVPERQVTPEAAVLGRRALMAGSAGLLAAGAALPAWAASGDKYPAGRAITPEPDCDDLQQLLRIRRRQVDLPRGAALPVSPWTIEFAGMVDKPRTMDLATC